MRLPGSTDPAHPRICTEGGPGVQRQVHGKTHRLTALLFSLKILPVPEDGGPVTLGEVFGRCMASSFFVISMFVVTQCL